MRSTLKQQNPPPPARRASAKTPSDVGKMENLAFGKDRPFGPLGSRPRGRNTPIGRRGKLIFVTSPLCERHTAARPPERLPASAPGRSGEPPRSPGFPSDIVPLGKIGKVRAGETRFRHSPDFTQYYFAPAELRGGFKSGRDDSVRCIFWLIILEFGVLYFGVVYIFYLLFIAIKLDIYILKTSFS